MLKRFLSITMIVLLAMTAWLVYSCKDLEFDYNFEHFFPVESDDAEFFYQFREKFGSDNEFIIIAVERPNGIFDKAFLKKVSEFCDSTKHFRGVRSVTSLTSVKSPIINSFGVIEVPLVNLNSEGSVDRDSAVLVNDRTLIGNLISPDAKSLAIYIRHLDVMEKSMSDSLLSNIETYTANHFSENTLVTGKLKSERAYLTKTQNELLLFMSVSFILVTIFLWFTFRNFWGVVVPLTVVVLAIIWTIGIMAVTGKAIDIMIILMPCILFVVGMSDVIHITSQFYEKIEEGYSKIDSIRLSLEEVGFATFLTCISTSIAFLTLNTTSIQPIRDFGTYTAIGVVVAYILSITVLPFILIHVKNPDRFKVHVVQLRWDRFLRKLIKWVFRNPVKIVVSTAILLIVALFGIGLIEVNNSVLDDLDENDPIKQEFKFFDSNYSGVRGFEMQVEAKNSEGILSYEAASELLLLEEYLKTSYGVGALISPLDVVRGFYNTLFEG